MQDQIKVVMEDLPDTDRHRWAFCARRNKNYTALQQAEHVVDEVVDALSNFLGADETPMPSKAVHRGAQ